MDFKELEDNKHEMNVSRESIDYMLNIIKRYKLKKVLEIGCFNGYSALHFSTACEKVKTIEIDWRAVEIAKRNFRRYSINNIEVLEGDAKVVLKNLNENFDIVFIDAVKNEYKDYLVAALGLVKKGFIYADNTVSHKEYMKEFFDYLEDSNLDWRELGIGKGLVEIRIS